ncbi:MAG: nucleotide sugar dehydrogenase [Bdellovibrionales bacterium]|nr:nucleotide sugar dehydrogenase [Bdellovibrionales bacterium]
MSISVIGLGRVGLMTLFHLSKKGFSVYAIDKDKEKILHLKKGSNLFFEPEFDVLLKKYHNKINFQTNPIDTQYNFIAIPTPFDEKKEKINLKFIESLLNKISQSKYEKKYVFIRSTLMPGNCKDLSDKFPKLSINYFPEFFREGYFVEDYKESAFSVLGCASNLKIEVFSQFQFPSLEICSLEEAEILKSMSNLFHGLKVSFANELGRIAKYFNSSPDKISKLFVKDTKLNISKRYLKPGFSFGGPCLAKDISSLKSFCDFNKSSKCILAEMTNKSNENHTSWVADQILKFKPKTISLLGFSFTGAKTIDYRGSSVLDLLENLSLKQKDLKIYGREIVNSPFYSFLKEDSKKFMESDLFILGGWTPLLKKYKKQLLNYKGVIFDLLIQKIPEPITKHPYYKNIYSKL